MSNFLGPAPYTEKFIGENGLKSAEEDRDEVNDWITSGYLCNYRLIPPRGKKQKAVIAIKVTLTEKISILELDEPLVHILFCGGHDASWEFNEFQLAPQNDEDSKVVLRAERLWEWFENIETTDLPWSDRQWAFSLPLIKINTVNDIRKQISGPVIRLLKGDTPEKAFKEASAVIRYRKDGSDYFRLND